jgi:hypothetical protein
MSYVHIHVSEKPDPAGVVECTWATGLELVRAALYGSPKCPPADANEREQLRRAGGGSDTKGSTYEQLAMGMGARFGVYVVPTAALPATEISEGTFLGVQGLYSHLSTHYRRWQPSFTGAHSVVIYKVGGILRICDPLAPWDLSWHGEPITWGAVRAFHTPLLLGAKVIAVTLPTVPETSTGGTDVQVLWDVTKHEGGMLTVAGDGVRAIRLRDGVLIPLPKGMTRPYDTNIKLRVPWPGGDGGLLRQLGYQIGEDVCCVLASQVTAVPNAPNADVAAAVAADRLKAHITWQA